MVNFLDAYYTSELAFFHHFQAQSGGCVLYTTAYYIHRITVTQIMKKKITSKLHLFKIWRWWCTIYHIYNLNISVGKINTQIFHLYAFQILTGITRIFRSRKILSAPIVVGPLAPSAIIYKYGPFFTKFISIL